MQSMQVQLYGSTLGAVTCVLTTIGIDWSTVHTQEATWLALTTHDQTAGIHLIVIMGAPILALQSVR